MNAQVIAVVNQKGGTGKSTMTITGMRGYNGLLAILNTTNEDFQSLYASINNCSGARSGWRR